MVRSLSAVASEVCQTVSVGALYFQSIAVEGYETGEHAPGLKLRGTGAYKAAHHIIKVRPACVALICLLVQAGRLITRRRPKKIPKVSRLVLVGCGDALNSSFWMILDSVNCNFLRNTVEKKIV